ncbi:MAG: hypothetical protein AB8E15_05020 [Bdellovibrionales bacterium]
MKNLIVGIILSLFTFGLQAKSNEISDMDNLQSAELLELDLELETEGLNFSEAGELQYRPPRRRPRPPRYRPPRRRPHPPRYNPPRRPRQNIVCYAENNDGRQYRARGQRPYPTQERAIRKCERNSYYPRSCYASGCYRLRR